MKRIQNPNRNGRPKMTAYEKKEHIITFKLESPELYAMKAKVRESGMSQSEFIRQSIKGAEVKQRVSPEHSRLIRQLAGMANNINQLAHKANAYGFSESSQQCRQAMNQVDAITKMILQ